jgi:hypothetical protein
MPNPMTPNLFVMRSALCVLAASLWVAPVRAEDSLLESAQALAASRGAGGAALAEKKGKLSSGEAPEVIGLSLGARQCIIAAAAVDPALPDVELSLRTPEGLAISDGATGPVAHLRYCASASEEQVVVRVKAQRAARFALGVWGVSKAVQAASLQSQTTPAVPPAPPPPPPKTLRQRFAELVKRAAVGMQPMTVLREEELLASEGAQRDVVLESERCYRVLALTEAPATSIALALTDRRYGSVISIKGSNLEAVLLDGSPICPAESGTQQLELRIEGASAGAAWQLFGKPNPAFESRWTIGGSGEALPAKRIRQLHKELAAQAPVTPFDHGELKTTEVHETAFEAASGQCYVAVAVGMPSLRALELQILDQRGNEVARSEQQGNAVSARACADLRGPWTVRTRAFKGYGGFGVQVFSTP